MTQNYVMLSSGNLLQNMFSYCFSYLDGADAYRADPLFNQYGLRVKFESEFLTPEGNYKIIICRVPKRQAALFHKVMEQMPRRMALFGYTEYTTYWENFVNKFMEKLGT